MNVPVTGSEPCIVDERDLVAGVGGSRSRKVQDRPVEVDRSGDVELVVAAAGGAGVDHGGEDAAAGQGEVARVEDARRIGRRSLDGPAVLHGDRAVDRVRAAQNAARVDRYR